MMPSNKRIFIVTISLLLISVPRAQNTDLPLDIRLIGSLQYALEKNRVDDGNIAKDRHASQATIINSLIDDVASKGGAISVKTALVQYLS